MAATPWCSGTSIALAVGSSASPTERRVAAVAADRIVRRGVKSAVFAEHPKGSWDLVLLIGTQVGHPRVAHLLEERDRLNPASPMARGPESSRGLTLTLDGQPTACVFGEDIPGLWSGVGRFLRHVSWRDGSFACSPWSDEFRPAMEVRGEVLSSHFVSNTYFTWEIADWRTYVEDMALWGMNLFITIPMHMADWTGVSPWTDPPRWESEERRRAWERHWTTHVRLSEEVHEMGLSFGVWVPPNDVPPMMTEPGWDRGGGRYVCPSLPDARKAIQSTREALIRGLPHLDYWFVPSADNGGCSCSKCHPWGDTYLALAGEQHEMLVKYHPGGRTLLSNQSLTHEENLRLCARLAEPEFGWVYGVAYAPGSNELYIQARETEEYGWVDWFQFGRESLSLKTLSRHLPPTVKLFLYPDLTHITRCQYHIWGIDPVAAWAYHRDPIFFRPRGYHRIFRQTACYSDGSFPYSEGIHDDLNQVLWLALNGDPERDPDDIVQEYWRWYVGEDAAPHAARAADSLERGWLDDLTRSPDVEVAVLESGAALDAMPPAISAGNWRADILRLRALMDQWLVQRLDYAAAVEKRVIARLREEDGTTKRGILQAANLARSGIADLGGQPEDDEILALAERVRKAGLHVAAIARIGRITGNLAWVVRTLTEAAEGDQAARAAAVAEVADYEAGFAYADCGCPRRDPYLVHGRAYIPLGELSYGTPFESLPDIRPSQGRMVVTYGDDEGVVYRFAGLDPEKAYDVRLTYFLPTFFTYRKTSVQRLEANGIEVHGPLELPRERPKVSTFPLPENSYRSGEVTLRFLKAGGGQATVVSEIWIRERCG